MAIVKRTLDPANPPKLSEATKARLDAMTDEQRTANALADPDNPPLSDDELLVVAAARLAKRTRAKQGMTQEAFATTYRIGHGRLRDVEQGRGKRGDSALVAYLRVIEAEPDKVKKILAAQD